MIPGYRTYSAHPNVRDNAPNKGAYDSKIRGFKAVSYPDAKGGNNGLTIFTITYAGLPDQARRLIQRIREGDNIGRRWRRSRYDNNRRSAAYGRLAHHLPRGGSYQEYEFEDTSLEAGETRVPRLVHDEAHDNFYVTLTHYRAYRQTETILRPATANTPMHEEQITEERNPFYRVKEIPFDKQADGGGARALKQRTVSEMLDY